MVLGFVGFLGATQPDGDEYSAVEAAYHTLRLFVLGWPDPNSVPVILDVARFLAAASTVVVAIRATLLLYAGRIEQLRAHRSRGHTIVCGLGRRGVSTVGSLRARGHRVVAIESDRRPRASPPPAPRAPWWSSATRRARASCDARASCTRGG